MGRSHMTFSSPSEFQVRRYTVLIEAAQLDIGDGSRWVGTWHIYQLPRSDGDMPVRYGDTDVVQSPDMAVGMARAIAKLVARSL